MLRQIPESSPEARNLNEETRRSGDANVKLRLGELVLREVRTRKAGAAEDAVEALRPLARAVHENEARGEDFVSASFLVQDDRRDAFTAAERRLAEQWGEERRLRLHGPLPPCTFVQAPREAHGAATDTVAR
ncbi:GvpL/GvpF family gas vesicle protein [Streptomyces sp. NRRL B-24484]|uniref:GvpL/GvpF family gas vesicle protein n=1 Tax=Streptomyces sp. NRRL B-24484 TaxID=1463833 RepID=UPI002D21C0EE|nr:GvpL/GvpF family gas vesicle protein [Streptomyces sp. NRRL B-24484]